MNKEQTQEAIVVMQEWLVGERIEFRTIGVNAKWKIVEDPKWNFALFEYRVQAARWHDTLADIDELAGVKHES